MRDEMLAHLSALYDEELTRSGDPTKAVNNAAERFGNPTELTAELQATVPKLEQWEMRLDRTFGWRPPETATRWMLRLSTQLLLVMMTACLIAAMFVFCEFGWSENVILVIRPIVALTIALPVSFFASGICYYRIRNSLVGVFGIRKSTGCALLWAALLAIATNAVGIGFLGMAYGGLPNHASDFFWILAMFGVMWAAFAFLHAHANGPQEIRDTTWALLDLGDQPLAA
jgi:ATP-dependent Clp protease ATP-binding subunit ClpC